MTANLSPRNVMMLLVLAGLAGCEGWDRRNDAGIDLSAPPEIVTERMREQSANLADELEYMMQLRQDYLEQLTRLEQVYLDLGDMARSNWARRQRDLTRDVLVYPFASDTTPEAQRSQAVRPEKRIPQADALFADGKELFDSFHGIPLVGALESSKKKAREAVRIWRKMIDAYPTSDKVDDASYLIGECYKEYLREDDMDNQLALRYYRWAIDLNPRTPWPARFQSAAVYDYRMHDRTRAVRWYRRVLEENEDYSQSNLRFAAQRLRELTDQQKSPLRPRDAMRTTKRPAPTGDVQVAGIPDAELEGESPAPDESLPDVP